MKSFHRSKKTRHRTRGAGEKYIRKKRKEEYNEEVVKNTHIILSEEKGMPKTMKALGKDICKSLKPYSTIVKVILKNISKEYNKLVAEFKYQFMTLLYVKNHKLFYQILNCHTKLSIRFFVKSYTASVNIKINQPNVNKFTKLKPLLILKNFNCPEVSSEMSDYLTIIQNVLRSIYPKLNLKEDSTYHARKVILYYFDPKDETIYFRQYVTTKRISSEARKSWNKHMLMYSNKHTDGDNISTVNKTNSKDGLNRKNTYTKWNNFLEEVGPRMSLKLHCITDQEKVIYSKVN